MWQGEIILKKQDMIKITIIAQSKSALICTQGNTSRLWVGEEVTVVFSTPF